MENFQVACGERRLGFDAVSGAGAKMVKPVHCGKGKGDGRLE